MRPMLLAAAASAASGGFAAGFVAAAWTACAQLAHGAAVQGPVWPLALIAAVLGALVAVRLLVCALATTLTLLLDRLEPAGADPSGSRAVLQRVALVASPRVLRPLLAAVLAGGLTLAIAAPATAAPGTAAPRTTAPATTAPATTAPATTAPGTTAPGLVTATAASGTPSVTASAPAADTGPRAPAGRLPAPGWHQLGIDGWRPSPRPQRPAASARPVTGPELVTSGSRGCADTAELVVRRGDTLWHLAARALGPGASAAEIAAEWPRWWAANRERVGDDPDLILPGTRLCAPPPPTAAPPTTKELR